MGGARDVSVPSVSRGARVALFYHRDTRNKFHGEAVYLRQFIREIGEHFDLHTIAPGSGALDPPRFSGVMSDMLWTCCLQMRALLDMKRIVPTGRRSVVVIADVYLYFLPMLIARIRRVPLVYLCSDLPGRYAASWSSSPKGRGLSMKLLRALVDRMVFASCDGVVVRTEAMRQAITSDARWAHLPTWVARHQPVRTPPDPRRVQAVLKEFPRSSSRLLVFAGDCHYPPNADAVEFILRELAPSLASRFPAAEFVIVGPGSEQWRSSAGPNVRVLGLVDDLSSVLYAAHVGLAPLRVEGGVSSKVIDYMAHGLTVVATPQAAVGQPGSPRIRVAPLRRFQEVVEEVLHGEDPIRAVDVFQRELAGEESESKADATSWSKLVEELSRAARPPGQFRRSDPRRIGRTNAPGQG